jgi:hypothetical protein
MVATFLMGSKRKKDVVNKLKHDENVNPRDIWDIKFMKRDPSGFYKFKVIYVKGRLKKVI